MKYFYHKANGEYIEHVIVFNDNMTPHAFYANTKEYGNISDHTVNTPDCNKFRTQYGSWVCYLAKYLNEFDIEEIFDKKTLHKYKSITKNDLFVLLI